MKYFKKCHPLCLENTHSYSKEQYLVFLQMHNLLGKVIYREISFKNSSIASEQRSSPPLLPYCPRVTQEAKTRRAPGATEFNTGAALLSKNIFILHREVNSTIVPYSTSEISSNPQFYSNNFHAQNAISVS